MFELGPSQMYEVDIKSLENTAKVLIAFLKCPHLKNREFSIMNKDAKNFDAAFMLPRDFLINYDDKHVPEESVVKALLENNYYSFSAVASFDEADRKRISLSSMAFAGLVPGLSDSADSEVKEAIEYTKNKILVNSFCPDGYEDKISRVIDYLKNAAR